MKSLNLRIVLLPLLLTGACAHMPSVYEPAVLRDGEPSMLAGIGELDNDGRGIRLNDGSHYTLHVVGGMRLQYAGAEVFVEGVEGVCGYTDNATHTISVAIDVAGCNYGSPLPTLLHELGHTYGLAHSRGIMSHNYAGPVGRDDLAAFRVAISGVR